MASAMGMLPCESSRLPAVYACCSSKGMIWSPLSCSWRSLFFAASWPIMAPASLMNSVRTMVGIFSCWLSSFVRNSFVFVAICGVDGNCRKMSRRVSAMLVIASFSGARQDLRGFVCVLLRRRVCRLLGGVVV